MAKKNQSRASRLSDAMSNILLAKEEIEMLRDEIENWKDGMEGTNLENTYKYEQLDECYEGFEDIINDLDDITGREDDILFPGMF